MPITSAEKVLFIWHEIKHFPFTLVVAQLSENAYFKLNSSEGAHHIREEQAKLMYIILSLCLIQLLSKSRPALIASSLKYPTTYELGNETIFSGPGIRPDSILENQCHRHDTRSVLGRSSGSDQMEGAIFRWKETGEQAMFIYSEERNHEQCLSRPTWGI